MRALILFLSCIMLVTAWTGMAQAVEFGPCPELSQAAHAPVYCDGDQSAADDKDCPRHLSCHAHHVATPGGADTPRVAIVTGDVFGAVRRAVLTGSDLEQALRPPKA